jgi:Zn finger protein HypA/HybF involved in hydrogenase expression
VPLQEYPVKMVEVVLVCECGEQMVSNGLVRTVEPPQYGHACPKCGIEDYQVYRYPILKTLRDE